MALWWGTSVEVRSALQRLHREGRLTSSELSTCKRRLAAMEDAALEVTPTEALRDMAAAALERFDLRAGDALQLAAALVLCREHPRGRTFVCFDEKLATAADLAGFTVLPG